MHPFHVDRFGVEKGGLKRERAEAARPRHDGDNAKHTTGTAPTSTGNLNVS